MQDSDALADMVILTVKSALAPVLERLAVSEQANRDLQARVLELSALRDRVTTIEVKSSMPGVTAELTAEPAVDITPVLERLAANEARIAVLGDIRERIAVVETKAAQPVDVPTVDLQPVTDRLMDLERRLDAVTDVSVRVGAIEAKSLAPVQDTGLADRLTALESRVVAAEMAVEAKSNDAALKLNALSLDLAKDIGAVRERVAVVEVRAQIPGPPGKDGADGLNGKDGQDGLGWDDLVAVQNDDRSISLKAHRGDRVKELGTARFPVLIQRGVFVQGKTYEQGDMATWGGSSWHCERETTDKPGEGSKDWTLVVKRGRDGKDGRDAKDPVPIVRV